MTPNDIKTKLRPLYDAALTAVSKGADIAATNSKLTEQAIAALRPPRYDLTQYQLCLPVDKVGEPSGLAAYVTPTPVLPLLAQPFVKQYQDSIVITCPIKGATTKSVHRARCEFQGLPAAEFTTSEPKRHEVAFAFRKPADLPGMKVGDEIVIAQFHCGEFPMVKIKARLDAVGFTLRAAVKHEAVRGTKDTFYTLAQAVPFDLPQMLVMEWLPVNGAVPQHLLFSINGLPVPPKAVPMDYPLTAGIAPTFGCYWQKEWADGEQVRYASVEFFR